jgi:hypothetical protein
MLARALLLACASFLWLSPASGQTTLNPDISLVGDIRAFTHNDKARPTEKNEFNLQSPDMEIVVAGYLNPYARADAVLAWEDGANAEVEELYATILRGLPLNLNLRAGKYRLEFGRLNSVHPHAYSFVNQPLPHTEFLGEEGLNDMAIRASFVIPTGKLYTELMGAILKGDILGAEEESGEESLAKVARTTDEETRIKPGYLARLATSAAVSENGELAGGVSVVTAEYDDIAQLRATIAGIDLKYKWRPNRNTSLTIEGEGLSNHRELGEGTTVTSYGGYGYLDYRFHQKYNVGSIFEYTQGAYDKDTHTSRFGGFVGFAPIEETTLIRLVGDWTTPGEGDGFWTATLQFVFSLGPHQPHNF